MTPPTSFDARKEHECPPTEIPGRASSLIGCAHPASQGRALAIWPKGRNRPGKHSTLFQRPTGERHGRAPKASLDELLTRAISSTRGSSDAQQQILERLGDLRTRFEEGRLRVAVIGQFKRGKSTLLNALLGAPVLPTGVTPVTAIPTFIEASNSAWARIEFNSGKEPIVTSTAHEIPRCSRTPYFRSTKPAQPTRRRKRCDRGPLGLPRRGNCADRYAGRRFNVPA